MHGARVVGGALVAALVVAVGVGLGPVSAARPARAATSSPDSFGQSVAISGDTALVGAPGPTSNINGPVGAAYLYLKESGGWRSAPSVTLKDPGFGFNGYFCDCFGQAVAIDGDTAVVTAWDTAYVYVKGASGWPTAPTVAMYDPAPGDNHLPNLFGTSVAIAGDTIVVGAPDFSGLDRAYLYVRSATGWPARPTVIIDRPGASRTGRNSHFFGISVALSHDTVVVGAQGSAHRPGDTYLYLKGAAGWPPTPSVTLADPGSSAKDFFGSSVAIWGNEVVVGAPGWQGAAAVYFYRKGVAGWPTIPTDSLTRRPRGGFGSSVAVSPTALAIGAPLGHAEAGTAFIFAPGAPGWRSTPTVERVAGSRLLGTSVAASSGTVIAGAPATNSAGTAYLFDHGAASWPSAPTISLVDPAG